MIRRILKTAFLLLTVAAPAAAQETIEYYGLDALGSVRVIFDGQGQVVGRMDYGPFGEHLREAIKFPTEQFAQLNRDAESGQDYAQARSYSAERGRFNSVDSVFRGLFNPQRSNRYTYVLNNPVGYLDANGLMAQALNRCHVQWWIPFNEGGTLGCITYGSYGTPTNPAGWWNSSSYGSSVGTMEPPSGGPNTTPHAGGNDGGTTDGSDSGKDQGGSHDNQSEDDEQGLVSELRRLGSCYVDRVIEL